MHFEILVEGQTELTALSIWMNAILGDYSNPHTWKIHKHRGIGHIPENPDSRPNKADQSLLHNLPSKLRAYGSERRNDLIVVVLVDLDEREDCVAFKHSLTQLLEYCHPPPRALFRIAIEELEAWYFGDKAAIKLAYPEAKQDILDSYTQDSQCGTWERLADAVYPGGVLSLKKDHGKRSPKVLEQKLTWAREISPKIDIESSLSPSFCAFRDGLRKIADTPLPFASRM